MRQISTWSAEITGSKSSESPQRTHAGPLRTVTSIQQASQIGAEERRGRGEPQSLQEEGKRAQLTASMGLRRTRATAHQAEVSDCGTSNVSEPESLRKTHLTWTEVPSIHPATLPLNYTYTRSSPFIASFSGGADPCPHRCRKRFALGRTCRNHDAFLRSYERVLEGGRTGNTVDSGRG